MSLKMIEAIYSLDPMRTQIDICTTRKLFHDMDKKWWGLWRGMFSYFIAFFQSKTQNDDLYQQLDI